MPANLTFRNLTAAVTLLFVPAALAVAPAALAAPAGHAACAGWKVVRSPSRGSASLNSVAATSAKDAWAVGSYNAGSGYKTLIEHWNGMAWKIVPSPNPANGGPFTTNALAGVVAISKTNAWAIGFYLKRSTSFRTLVVHWNGTKWSVVPSPNAGAGENTLAAVAARNGSDIWAVGYRQARPGGWRQTLTEHWGGARWRVVHSPNVGSGDGNLLFGTAVDPAGRAWAVGTNPKSFSNTLALRRVGSAWRVTPTINPGDGDRFLQAVAAPSPRIALAVGSDLKGQQVQALAEKWTGSAWSQVPAASPSGDYNSLQAIAATSATSAWAVGSQRSMPSGAPFRTPAEHWNGTAWTTVASPSPGTGDDWLYGIADVPHGGFWAVGTAGDRTLTEFHC